MLPLGGGGRWKRSFVSRYTSVRVPLRRRKCLPYSYIQASTRLFKTKWQRPEHYARHTCAYDRAHVGQWHTRRRRGHGRGSKGSKSHVPTRRHLPRIELTPSTCECSCRWRGERDGCIAKVVLIPRLQKHGQQQQQWMQRIARVHAWREILSETERRVHGMQTLLPVCVAAKRRGVAYTASRDAESDRDGAAGKRDRCGVDVSIRRKKKWEKL